MPDAAEVAALVLELLYLDYFWKAVDPLDERVLDRPAHAAGKNHELRRRERLVVKKYDQVLEQSAPDCGGGVSRQFARQVDPGDFGTQGAGNLLDRQGHYCSILILAFLMIAP